jgi:hypothetical protein
VDVFKGIHPISFWATVAPINKDTLVEFEAPQASDD